MLTKQIKHFLRSWRSQRFTIIFIPHHSPQFTLKISPKLTFLLSLFLSILGISLWSLYLVSLCVNMWYTRANSEINKFKLNYLTEEVKSTQDFLARVADTDAQVRSILEMSVIGKNQRSKNLGGPNSQDYQYLDRILDKKVQELTVEDISYRFNNLRKQMNLQIQSVKEIKNHIKLQKKLYATTPNLVPCIPDNITLNYGYRTHPVTGEYKFHYGIDISGARNSPIYAAAAGRVVVTDYTPGYGRIVVLEHGYGYQTRYSHLNQILVKTGDRVVRKKVIGYMGSTGNATCTHLHYEIWYKGKAVNPAKYLQEENFFTRRIE